MCLRLFGQSFRRKRGSSTILLIIENDEGYSRSNLSVIVCVESLKIYGLEIFQKAKLYEEATNECSKAVPY